MHSFKTIGFIGVGVMGEPMCRHLAQKSGCRVLVVDQHQEPLDRLTKHGALVSSIEEVAASADVVMLSLPSGAVMEKVVIGSDGQPGILSYVRPGQVIVDLSTSDVETTHRVCDALEEKGAHFIDAPVTRGREAAEEGRLAVLVGARQEVLATVRSLLETFATEVMYCGEPGCGQIAKILNNSVLYQTVLALGEAMAMGRKAGIDPEKLFAAFAAGSADSYALRIHGMKAILPGSYPDKAFPVSYVRKDVQYAVDMGAQVCIDAVGSKTVVDYCDGAIKLGLGDKYGPAICAVFDRQAEAGVSSVGRQSSGNPPYMGAPGLPSLQRVRH